MSESSESKTLERVKSLVSIIPSPQSLKAKEAKVKEKRIKLRYNEGVREDEIYVSRKLADELEIKDSLYIAIPGRKSMRFRAVIRDDIPYNEVWGNPSAMKLRGIADNSIVTVRGA